MFREPVVNTPFTDDIANIVCSNIVGDNYNGDMSIVATARALLMSRMSENDHLDIITTRNGYPKSVVEQANVEIAINAIAPELGENKLRILELNRGKDDNSFVIDYLVEHIGEYRNVKRIEKVTQFFQKAFKCACFVDEEKRSTYLFTEQLTFKTFHYLQCGILIYLPWYFNKEIGITQEERDLIESLRLSTPERYLECLATIAKNYDFREQFTRKSLIGLETQVEKNELIRVRNDINNLESQISEYTETISRLMRSLRDNNIRMMGLEFKIRSDEEEGHDSEIMNYFLKNKRLYLRNSMNGIFEFDVKDYLMFWDEQMAQKMFDNIRSYAYNPGREVCVSYTREEMKKLLEEIFIERNFKIKVCATYRFNINNMYVSAISHPTYGYEFNDSTPNPHIDRYSCLGNYESAINKFLINYDYIGAIEQCVASCRSLNFGDGAVMQEFFMRWYGVSSRNDVNMKCIELPNGEVVNPEGAIEYMREQENASKESEVTDGEDN